MIKSTLDIMRECAELDMAKNINTENIDNEMEITDFLESVREMPIGFDYDASAVPVLENETYTGKEYYIEFDNLYKLSNTLNIGIKESMELVAKRNDIKLEDCYLVLDEKGSLKEALKCKSDKEKSKIGKTIKDIKDKAIKVVCKKK